MKTIALFGASGKTGMQFLKLALEKGYTIKALVRTPEKLPIQSPRLQLIKGDVLNGQDVYKTIQGTEVVVSLFGHVKGSPDWLQTNGTKHMVQVMKKEGIRKIISLSGGGLPYQEDKPKMPDRLIRLIMKVFVPNIFNDAIAHARVLQESNLDWVIIRGPRLTNGERKGHYRVGWVGVNASTQIARADLADFILKQVEENTYIRKMPLVSY